MSTTTAHHQRRTFSRRCWAGLARRTSCFFSWSSSTPGSFASRHRHTQTVLSKASSALNIRFINSNSDTKTRPTIRQYRLTEWRLTTSWGYNYNFVLATDCLYPFLTSQAWPFFASCPVYLLSYCTTFMVNKHIYNNNDDNKDNCAALCSQTCKMTRCWWQC